MSSNIDVIRFKPPPYNNMIDDDPDNPGMKRPYIDLIYDNTIDTTNIKNVLLIDSNLAAFQNYANTDTFPIIYDRFCTMFELMDVLRRKFSSIARIAIVCHFGNNLYFIDNTLLFSNKNIQFIVGLIKQFNV